MKIQDFFQKGYYINLDSRPDRIAVFLENMKKAGLEGFFERFSAYNHKDTSSFNYTYPHQACCRSHVELLRKAYNAGYERVLILEDDVFFVEGGLEAIENSLDSLSKIKNWDLMYLGSILIDEKLHLVDRNLLKQEKMLTTHAVGYSRSGLDFTRKCVWEVPATIDGWYQNITELNKYATYPLGLAQYHGPSDLNDFGFSAPVSDYVNSYQKEFSE